MARRAAVVEERHQTARTPVSSPPATGPLLPKGITPGRPPVWTRRQLIDGMRWRTRTSVPWRRVPERYGPWDRVHALFRRRQREGAWVGIGGDPSAPARSWATPKETGPGASKQGANVVVVVAEVCLIASLVASGAEHRSNGPARARMAAPGGFVVLSYARPGCPSLETSCDPDPRCLASLWR
ncbi:transposase [Streptomyces sp. NPDC001634]|uniref:transposase n=1 Tax=Streptomyces sp. NPDC001634 TaxID=3154390 RepID=UPI00331D252E